MSRYDFENVSSEKADAMMESLRSIITYVVVMSCMTISAVPQNASELSKHGKPLTMTSISEFAYDDPVDHSRTDKQGIIMTFATGERVVIRLSGTGSSGATIRVYVEKHCDVSQDKHILDANSHDVLREAFQAALSITQITVLTGKSKPDVST